MYLCERVKSVREREREKREREERECVRERERERERERRQPEARDADKATERKLEKNQKTFPGVIKIWFI